jgi:soluble calcium-activated nucleotidase 1
VTWRSFLKTGTLTVHSDKTISVKWDEKMVELTSHISEKGRGVELSELIVFNGKLYTIDDRSGIGEKLAMCPAPPPPPNISNTCTGWE